MMDSIIKFGNFKFIFNIIKIIIIITKIMKKVTITIITEIIIVNLIIMISQCSFIIKIFEIIIITIHLMSYFLINFKCLN
jgi:hypothetical protein